MVSLPLTLSYTAPPSDPVLHCPSHWPALRCPSLWPCPTLPLPLARTMVPLSLALHYGAPPSGPHYSAPPSGPTLRCPSLWPHPTLPFPLALHHTVPPSGLVCCPPSGLGKYFWGVVWNWRSTQRMGERLLFYTNTFHTLREGCCIAQCNVQQMMLRRKAAKATAAKRERLILSCNGYFIVTSY